MVVERVVDRVAEGCFPREVAVFQRYFHLLHERVVSAFVLADVGEVEIDELQHGLYVLRSGATVDCHHAFAHGERSSRNLSGQCFGQFGRRERAQSAALNDIVEELRVHVIRQSVSAVALATLTR